MRESLAKAATLTARAGKSAALYTKKGAIAAAPHVKKAGVATLRAVETGTPKAKEAGSKALVMLRKHPELVPITAGLAIAVGPELAISTAAIEGSALLASALLKIWDEWSGKNEAKLTRDEHHALQQFTAKLKARRAKT
jgi:hypothetical protein